MSIFGSFKAASKTINDARADIDKGRKSRPKDEVAAKRQQKNAGGKK